MLPWYVRGAVIGLAPFMLLGGLLHLEPVGFGVGTVLTIGLILDRSAVR